MVSRENEQFACMSQGHKSPAPKLTMFHIFIPPLHLKVTLFSKTPT